MDYNTFKDGLTMTVSECSSHYFPAYVLLGILILVLSIFIIILAFKFDSRNKFIKEKKLEKEFQEFKKVNKGLL